MLLGKLVLSQRLDTLYSFSNYYSNSFQMHGVGQKSHAWAPWKCLFEKFLFFLFFFFMFCFLCLRHNLILLVGGRGSSWDTCQTLQFVAGSCNQRCPCWIPCGSVRQHSVNASLGGYEGVSCCCHRPGSSQVCGGSVHPLGPYLSCQAILRGISGAVCGPSCSLKRRAG